jgi:hypothetical protein
MPIRKDIMREMSQFLNLLSPNSMPFKGLKKDKIIFFRQKNPKFYP